MVHLTGDELTAASSAVAALAIAGGYLGVRSANRNAVKIAREERSSQRKDELDALKRTTYVNCLTELTGLVAASMTVSSMSQQIPSVARLDALRQQLSARLSANAAVAAVELSAPDILVELAREAVAAASNYAPENKASYIRAGAKLQVAMRYDLFGTEIPSAQELDRMALNSIAKLSPGAEGQKSSD